jgi:hypothetical protein
VSQISFDRLGTFKGDEVTMHDSRGRMVGSASGDRVIYQCDECGALVNNTAMHEIWHDAQQPELNAKD